MKIAQLIPLQNAKEKYDNHKNKSLYFVLGTRAAVCTMEGKNRQALHRSDI